MKSSYVIILALAFILSMAACKKESSNDSAAKSQKTEITQDSTLENQSQERLSPPDTAVLKKDDWNIMISYSSPSVRGRKIWGDLVPYEKVWRTGANEATVFYSNKTLVIAGDTLPAGRYSLFSIPGESEWTLIFNNEWNQWGAYEYDEEKDALRVKTTPEKIDTINEALRFELLEVDSSTALMHFYWEQLHLAVPLTKVE